MYETARRIRARPETADADCDGHLDGHAVIGCAVQAGANDFIGKPADATEIAACLRAQLDAKAARDALASSTQPRTAGARTNGGPGRGAFETAVLQRKTESAYIDTLDRLAMAAEYRDKATAAHLHRMSHYAPGWRRRSTSVPTMWSGAHRQPDA